MMTVILRIAIYAEIILRPIGLALLSLFLATKLGMAIRELIGR